MRWLLQHVGEKGEKTHGILKKAHRIGARVRCICRVCMVFLLVTRRGSVCTWRVHVCTWAWVDVSHRRILNSLQPHYQTLERLELSHEDYYPYQFDDDVDEISPITFTSFTNLKKLQLCQIA